MSPPPPGQEGFCGEAGEAVAESRRCLCLGLHGEGRQCPTDGPEQGTHCQVPSLLLWELGVLASPCATEVAPWVGPLLHGVVHSACGGEMKGRKDLKPKFSLNNVIKIHVLTLKLAYRAALLGCILNF